jgi:hypothetical protein
MLIQDFGERAVECVKLAERAHLERDRQLFIEMARAWCGLYEERPRSSQPTRKPH